MACPSVPVFLSAPEARPALRSRPVRGPLRVRVLLRVLGPPRVPVQLVMPRRKGSEATMTLLAVERIKLFSTRSPYWCLGIILAVALLFALLMGLVDGGSGAS